MKSSPMITLFARPQLLPPRGSAAFTASIVAHIAGCCWLFFGLAHAPRIENHSTLQHFTVRVLTAPPITAPQVQRSSGSAGAQSPPQQQTVAEQALPQDAPAPAPSAASTLSSLQAHQQQTLVQPDAPHDVLLLHKTPIPTVFLWAPVTAPVKPVIQAPLQKSIVARLRPSTDPPNREPNPSDLRLSSTNFTTALNMPPPSTTSPIVVRGPDPAKQMPQTVSKPGPEPTPVRILSLSDLQAQDGPVAIPLANATARPSVLQSLSSGRSENPADTGHNTAAPASKQTGASPTQTPAPPTDKPAPAAQNKAAVSRPTQSASGPANKPVTTAQNSPVPGPANKASTGSGSAAPVGPGAGPTPGPSTGTAAGNEATLVLDSGAPVTRLSLPKDGQFGVVVVGTSLADQYPEIAGIWNGRLVYTVYLHVGTGKSWILQYSMPTAAPTAGKPEAPYPYDIVRPHFSPDDYTADALLVHGFVNIAGRFDHLALAFPQDFTKAKLLLGALQQWQFRPARQNGQVAAVEVLLIIPAETE
jgi:hypothetical protein